MITPKKKIIWYLLPVIITLFIITFFPLIYALTVSLRDYSLAGGKQVHEFNNFKNFTFVMTDTHFYYSLWVTFKLTAICLVIELGIGLGLAILFTQPNYKLEPVGLLMILPMAIAPVVIGLVFRWFYSAEVGFIGYILQLFGIAPPSWIANKTAALFSIVIADVWEWTPYVFLICMAGLRSIKGEIYEAAAVDGASGWKRFRYVTLPLLRPTLIIVLMLRAIPVLKEFDKIFIITDGGPGIATQATTLYIFKQFLWFNNLGTATASALILLAIIIGITQIMFAYLRRQEKW
jgi:multiple sugar transport system permease protein